MNFLISKVNIIMISIETPDSLNSKKGVGLTPLTTGMFGYSLLRPHLKKEYFNDIYKNCMEYGIPIEGFHTETGPGVYEAALVYSDALEMADRSHLFKTCVKQTGLQHGVTPCFMAKPYQDQPGCSGHIHVSLENKLGENLFKDETTMMHFVSGILHGLPSICAILMPTINSYKRIVENYWYLLSYYRAPLTVSFGEDDRNSALRIIKSPPRIEVRVPGADVNPYLAFSAIIACGLHGIKNKLSPVTGQNLPRSLAASTAKMMEPNSFARLLLGDGFVDHFGSTRKNEVRLWEVAVTDWELKRYMETV